ncbi:MAG: right-handed parallel beta-helix repeat-containing protein [Pirellulales bacterium]|nr:right-handed parallel beta-helix repeat-containing protein [Pirellulales bacterium]
MNGHRDSTEQTGGLLGRVWDFALIGAIAFGWPSSLAAWTTSAVRQGAGRTYVVARLHPAASDENPGTAEKPFKTITRAAEGLQAGDTVVIEDGLYRESVKITASGTRAHPITFQAAPMANVAITGAIQITDWKREEGEANIFSTEWPYEYTGWARRRTQPDDDFHIMIGRAEQVYVDNHPLLQVLSREHLARGTFYVDIAHQRLYIHDRTGMDIVKQRSFVEASVRQLLWECRASFVHVRGLRFRYACNTAQMGAVTVVGDHNVLEDCVIEDTNGSGSSFTGTGITVRRCLFRNNGWTGFDVGQGHDFLMTECVCENNNTKGFNRDWGAVNKLVLCRKAVIDKSIFRDNRGHGVWFDIGNEDCEVRNCLIMNNENAGIFYEISYGLRAHDNVIIGNGLAPRHGAWGANGGIAISSSPHCIVERNLLIANKEGLQFREQGRATPRVGEDEKKSYAVWNHDNTIRNNIIAHNRDAQTWGWFATGDGRLWPRTLFPKMTGKPLPVPFVLPAGADLDRLESTPEGMTLEDLRLSLTGNLYAVKPGQRLYIWGCGWDRCEIYATIPAVAQALNLESGSQVIELQFADWATLDLRVPTDSPVLKSGCYPQGEVPSVRLGALP